MKDNLEFAGLTVEPGQSLREVLPIRVAGVNISLPVFLINGAGTGPTLCITAGIHGSEYPCVESALRLGQTLDPATLQGQVIIVPIANPVAFAARSIYVTPPDGKNLNRQFPGNSQGTFSQALAYWLFNNVIRRGDYYIDLHGGDMIEALLPFGSYFETGNDKVDRAAEGMAKSFGLPYLVLSDRKAIAGATHMEAAEAGVPAILEEAGGQGVWDDDTVQILTDGLHRVLAHLEMTAPAPAVSEPKRLEAWSWLRSEHNGVYYPAVKVGEHVTVGQDLGRVADVFGNTLQALQAPRNGVVLFLVTSLAMNSGDPLLAIAE